MGWYSQKETAKLPLTVGKFNPLPPPKGSSHPGCRWIPDFDGSALVTLYVYVRYQLRAKYPFGQLQLALTRETDPEDQSSPFNVPVFRKNQTFEQWGAVSPEAGWPVSGSDALAVKAGLPLRWDLYVGPEFASAFVLTRHMKAFALEGYGVEG